MIFFIYNLIVLILLPALLIRVLFKSFKDIDYLKNITNRLGFYKEKGFDGVVWFHAVSLGEVIASESLIHNIIKDHKLVLTVSTPTGLRQANKIFDDRVKVVYAPWDFYFFINNFINHFKPSALIIFETEIWPSMIHVSSSKGLPIILCNARLSKESHDKYLHMNFFMREIFQKITLVLAQSSKHVDRFITLGVNNNNIKKVGSLKFDAKILSDTSENIERDKNIIIAVSTHPGEEEIICNVYRDLINLYGSLKLVLVPRHPERSESVSEVFTENKVKNVIHEGMPNIFNENEVTIIKGIGFLNTLYKMANISFIGGSLLKDYGSHNIIEASANRCPFIVGPYMKNFEDIMNQYIHHNGCIQLNDSSELYDSFVTLLNDNELKQNMVDNSSKVFEDNKGSLEKQYNYINKILN